MAFQFGSYNENERERVRRAQEQLDALQRPGEFSSPWTQKVTDQVAAIENRKPFQYDVNGDALYQMYKDQYMTAGRQAMADTIGKAASMTGGYGNSYAASAGNQAYQAYLGQLNAMIPQLYQLAYNRYTQEGQDLKDLYTIYAGREQTDYGQYRDKVGDYQTDRSYYAGRLDSERNWDYGLWSDEEQRRYQNYQLAMAEAAAAASGGGVPKRKPSGSTENYMEYTTPYGAATPGAREKILIGMSDSGLTEVRAPAKALSKHETVAVDSDGNKYKVYLDSSGGFHADPYKK